MRVLGACAPARRPESLLRLHAYRQILRRSLLDRTYWAPMKNPAEEQGPES